MFDICNWMAAAEKVEIGRNVIAIYFWLVM